ncbi:MAG: acyl-CoA synthetase [Deltaproteobacteria bacterium]
MEEQGFWNRAQLHPERLALVDPQGRGWSRGDLLAECNQISSGLRALGVAPGATVAIAAPNCAEFYQLYLAVAQSGWYLTPLNWHLAPAEIAFIVKDCNAAAFIAHEKIATACIAAADEINFPPAARFAIGEVAGFRSLDELKAMGSPEMPAERAPGAVMNYTSGTTGNPKGVKRDLAPAEIDPGVMGELLGGFLMLFGVQPEAGNVHLVGSPLYHTAVLMHSASSLNLGHTVVLMDKWLPEEMLRLIDKHKVTLSHMVPTQFHRLLMLPEDVRAKYDCSSTRTMIHAAAPCPPEIKRRMLAWWGESIWEYYAATEGGGTICSPQEWLENPGTVGKAWAGAVIQIIDEEKGQALPTGERGTIFMKLPENMAFEYKGDAAKTKKNRLVIDGELYFTVGDIGYLNEGGFLFLCDRKIDMIISGGANIYPAEIENVLITHPQVGDVAVFGIPNEDWGEEIKAVIEPAPGIPGDDALRAAIFAFCKDKLAKFKTPKSIDFTDAMPRDPNGKLYKRKLRDPFWKDQKRAI